MNMAGGKKQLKWHHNGISLHYEKIWGVLAEKMIQYIDATVGSTLSVSHPSSPLSLELWVTNYQTK